MAATSRTLFLLVAVLWTAIGVLAPALLDRGVGPTMLFISERTDARLFGAPSREILETNWELRTLRRVIVDALAGMLFATGVLTAGIAWFGLDEPRAWALATLTVVGIGVLPFWWVSLAPYRRAGISLTLGDIPPFMWVPALLLPAACILGWIAYVRM